MVETEVDRRAPLSEACNKPEGYPHSLLTNTTSGAFLAFYETALDQYNKRLCVSSEDPVHIRFWDDSKVCDINRGQELTEHLVAKEEPDPKCRHVFLESAHSRAPLNCTPYMLKLLLTYHQVPASFLDALFAFGDQEDPQDVGLAHFRSGHRFQPFANGPVIHSLGRSGNALCHSFLLRSVEPSKREGDPWAIRQFAVYHQFDGHTGRSLWITVQGNNGLQKAITGDPSKSPAHLPPVGADIVEAFRASLYTHVIYFHYCERNWRWFIRDMEKRARSTGRASALWLGNEPRFATGMPVPPKHAPLRSAGVPEKSSILQYITRLLTFRAASPDEAEQPPPGHPGYKVAMNQLKYQDLQSLASLARQIEEARLTVQLNRRVLEEAIAYYQEAVESDAIESKLRRQMAKSVLNFSGQVHEIAEKLKTSQTQLESLGTRVKNDADLSRDLLLHRDIQMVRVSAEDRHRLADRRAPETTLAYVLGMLLAMLLLVALLLGYYHLAPLF